MPLALPVIQAASAWRTPPWQADGPGSDGSFTGPQLCMQMLIALAVVACVTSAGSGGGDPNGARAVALQQAVVAAPAGARIALSGTYNFSTSSFLIEGKAGLTLRSTDPAAAALFVFGYKKIWSDENKSRLVPSRLRLQPGVNITNSQHVSILGATIDYSPKSPALFCNPRAPPAPVPAAKTGLVHGNVSVNETLGGQRLAAPVRPGICPHPSGPGITLHMFNSSDTLVEDLTIHAAPYMAGLLFIKKMM